MHRGRKTIGWATVGALAACAAMGGGAAQAAVITETAPVVGNLIVDPGQDVLVRQFDPGLGTLTGVSVSLAGQFTPAVAFGVNSPSFPPLPPVQFNPYVEFFTLGLRQSLASESVESVNGPATGTPETVDLTGQLPVADLPVDPIDPGYLDFYMIASSGAVLPPDTYITADQGTIAAQLAVSYTYAPGTAVPEPASLALLVAGLLALFAIRSGGRKPAST